MFNYEKRNNKWFFLLFGGCLTLIINYYLYDLIIPDPCYYHNHQANFWINLFYNTGSITNGHPEPNIFNFLFTIIMGLLIGNMIYNYSKKNKIES
ncbi:hypothetical protein [Mariniflexile sp. HMF6888]|uniref:hypothetical protein n=1 Tax=Mariniflexile sp. HMF6888 TaxID=3373086 RepID=UPI0037ABC0A3